MRKGQKRILAVLLSVVLLVGCGNQTVVKQDSTQNTSQLLSESQTQSESQAQSESQIQTEFQDESSVTEKQETETEKQEEVSQKPQKEEETKPEVEKNTEKETEKVSSSKALKVVGTKLCDQNGNPIQLKGISTHGLSWFPEYVNEDLIKEFHDSWGMNVFRLAMYTAEYNGYCTGGNQKSLKDLVKKGVDAATKNEMYVIIDWHVLNDDGNGMHANPKIYKEEAKAFFKEMSKKYKDNPYVIYEICNEPNGNTTWADIKEYANEIIPVIKKNNKDAVIIVGTPTWSQEVDKAAEDPITGYSNIMYALHFYAATHGSWLRDRMENAINAGLPIFVSEYGICDASGNGGINYDEAKAWTKVMDKHKVSYVMWNLSNKDETSSIIKSGVSKTSGLKTSDLSESGKWLYKLLGN